MEETQKSLLEVLIHINLHEKDLNKAFIMAWNTIIENKEEFIERWSKLEKKGNPLERLKARQFKTIVEKGVLLDEVDNDLVNLVLEKVEVYDLGILKFYLLDGTELGIAID